MATCEVSWLKVLLHDFGYDSTRPVTLFCDNMSSMQLASNPVFHARTKHIEVHYHFVREKVLDGTIEMVYVSTQDQVADIFTKALPHDKHCKFRDMLGVFGIGLNSRGSVEKASSRDGFSPP